MGRVCVVLAMVAGCSFEHGAAVSDASLSDSDVDAPDGRPIDASAGACGGKVWFSDFSTDPTQLDGNGDGVKDWMLRDMSAFPTSQLANGVWSTPTASQPLDSQPKQTFVTRTLVHVRMRNTTVSGAKGAVFWINVGYDGSGTFAPLFIDAKLQGGSTQTVHVMRKTTAGVEEEVGTVAGLGTGFVDIDLDIRPSTLMFTYKVGNSPAGASSLNRLASTSTDEWATVVGFSGAAEFDEIRVEVCP